MTTSEKKVHDLISDALVSDEQVKEAIRVILSDKAAYSTSLNYAVNYALLALDLSGEELRVQCLYILNNIPRWRNPLAPSVRTILKTYTRQ